MSTPKMCDVCEKLAPPVGMNNPQVSPPRDAFGTYLSLPEGWQYIGMSSNKMTVPGGEVCSKACATLWIARHWDD